MGYKNYSHHFEEDELKETAMTNLQTAVEALERKTLYIGDGVGGQEYPVEFVRYSDLIAALCSAGQGGVSASPPIPTEEELNSVFWKAEGHAKSIHDGSDGIKAIHALLTARLKGETK